MNKTYRSVWSETDQTWVAAPETAKTRRKSSSNAVVIAGSALGIVAGLSSTHAFAAGTVGQGGLEICSGVKGYAWGYTGGSELLDCSSSTAGGSDGLAFSLNNAGDANGGYGYDTSTARVAGYQNGTLDLKGKSVLIHGPTTFDSVVTMSNKKIVQLAAGTVSASSTDAVNGSQLYAAVNSGGIKYFHANSSLNDSVAYGTESIAIGGAAKAGKPGLANQQNTLAIGANAIAYVAGSMAIGTGAQTGTTSIYTNDANLIAIGTNASAAGNSSVALGANTLAGYPGYSAGAVAVGQNASATPTGAVAVGRNSLSTETSAVAIGNASTVKTRSQLARLPSRAVTNPLRRVCPQQPAATMQSPSARALARPPVPQLRSATTLLQARTTLWRSARQLALQAPNPSQSATRHRQAMPQQWQSAQRHSRVAPARWPSAREPAPRKATPSHSVPVRRLTLP
jgi:autotransporter adhesin